MGALHECYTSGISAMVSFSKKAGTTEFNGYNCKFAIVRKESKDGTVSYDGRKFMNLLATIAFQYICGWTLYPMILEKNKHNTNF